MKLNEIKEAVEAGKRVFWVNKAYEVIKDGIGQFLIKSNFKDSYREHSYIGLTHRDEVTMNGDETEFFIGA